MDHPTLDREIRKAIDGLTLEEVDESALESIRKHIGTPKDVERERNLRKLANYPYEHEILWYGVHAVVHAYVMRMALDISAGRLSLDKFIEKFGLDFEGEYGHPEVSLQKIRSNGVFIPRQALYQYRKKRRSIICLFHGDYGNRVQQDRPDRPDPWPDKQYARQLIARKWQPADLENQELVEQGVKFGRDMWRTCVDGFELYKKDEERGKFSVGITPQAQLVTDLGNRLIAYYNLLVNAPNR